MEIKNKKDKALGEKKTNKESNMKVDAAGA